MLWGCFSCNGVGPMVKIVGNMDATYYVGNILETVMLPVLQSAVVYEVERWPHTPNSVGSNPSAAVDCLP